MHRQKDEAGWEEGTAEPGGRVGGRGVGHEEEGVPLALLRHGGVVPGAADEPLRAMLWLG